MKENYQRNYTILAKKIIKTGLKALDPKFIISKIDFTKFNINKFDHVYLIGFGKGSSALAREIKKKIKYVTDESVVDVKNFGNDPKTTIVGTHPLPSKTNITATKKIIQICKGAGKDDLIIAIVCGGGSSLLVYTVNSLKETQNICQELIISGATIKEVNIVRTHLDKIKGGGLAKIAFPANLISLIVSDVFDNDLKTIASGPTVINKTTIDDAKNILKKYQIDYDNLKFCETSKDKKIFSRTKNIIIADNKMALRAMAKEAKKCGLKPIVNEKNINNLPDNAAKKLINACPENSALIAAGEIKLKIGVRHGKGGRNTHLAASALKYLKPNVVFASIASDGHDNSNAAGSIVDYETVTKCQKMKLDIDDYINNFDTYNLFIKTNNLFFTGLMPINVSDIYLVLRK